MPLQVAEHFEDESVLVVSGRSDIWKNEKILVQSSGTDIYSTVEKTIGWARIDQPETFFRNTAVEKMGLLNIQLHYVMDREWWIRYLMYFGTKNIKKTDSKNVDDFVNEYELNVSSYTARVPEVIFKSGKNKKIHFLRSLFQADGCVRVRNEDGRNSGDIVLSTISEWLLPRT